MKKTKLMTLATMAALTLGALAPISAKAADLDGTSKGSFTVTEETDKDQLILAEVPNMVFDAVSWNDIVTNPTSSNLTSLTRTATSNDTHKVKIRDTYDTKQDWTLKAKMTNFTTTDVEAINTSGITVSGFDSVAGSGGTIGVNKDGNLLNSNNLTPNAENYEATITTTGTKVGLLQNSNLSRDAAGKTYTSDITWTLENTTTF